MSGKRWNARKGCWDEGTGWDRRFARLLNGRLTFQRFDAIVERAERFSTWDATRPTGDGA